jgi:hypothetical protein
MAIFHSKHLVFLKLLLFLNLLSFSQFSSTQVLPQKERLDKLFEIYGNDLELAFEVELDRTHIRRLFYDYIDADKFCQTSKYSGLEKCKEYRASAAYPLEVWLADNIVSDGRIPGLIHINGKSLQSNTDNDPDNFKLPLVSEDKIKSKYSNQPNKNLAPLFAVLEILDQRVLWYQDDTPELISRGIPYQRAADYLQDVTYLAKAFGFYEKNFGGTNDRPSNEQVVNFQLNIGGRIERFPAANIENLILFDMERLLTHTLVKKNLSYLGNEQVNGSTTDNDEVNRLGVRGSAIRFHRNALEKPGGPRLHIEYRFVFETIVKDLAAFISCFVLGKTFDEVTDADLSNFRIDSAKEVTPQLLKESLIRRNAKLIVSLFKQFPVAFMSQLFNSPVLFRNILQFLMPEIKKLDENLHKELILYYQKFAFSDLFMKHQGSLLSKSENNGEKSSELFPNSYRVDMFRLMVEYGIFDDPENSKNIFLRLASDRNIDNVGFIENLIFLNSDLFQKNASLRQGLITFLQKIPSNKMQQYETTFELAEMYGIFKLENQVCNESLTQSLNSAFTKLILLFRH